MENGQFIKDDWQFWLALYTEVVVDPLTDLNHNEEAAFILWGNSAVYVAITGA